MSKRRKNSFTTWIGDLVDDTKDFVDDVLDRAKDVEKDVRKAARKVVDDDKDDKKKKSNSTRAQLAGMHAALADLTETVNKLAALQLASAKAASARPAVKAGAAA